MNQLNDKERAALIADMKSFDEEMPSIGIFLYNPQDHCLVDVDKKEITPREVEEARAKGVDVINYPELHYNHHTQVKDSLERAFDELHAGGVRKDARSLTMRTG